MRPPLHWLVPGLLMSVALACVRPPTPAAEVAPTAGTARAVKTSAEPAATLLARASLHLAPTSSMHLARACHTATRLLDGRVLVAGGIERDGVFFDSAELYDPATGTFEATGRMTTARACHTATLLPDGKVLIAGGSTRQWLSSAEIFDPVTGAFTPTGEMSVARGGATATLLPDGKVLIAGGSDGSLHASAEVYDAETGTFSATGEMRTARASHTATSLPGGRVLITGGGAARGPIMDSAELYDPVNGAFTLTGPMTTPRHKHAAALLPDGDVLIAGGADARDWRGRYTSAEVYDAITGAFGLTSPMQSERFKFAEAVVRLKDGAVLVAGSSQDLELYDPATHTFGVAREHLDTARFFSTATLLADGQVLITGGYDLDIVATARAWIFTP
jgi:WD40 repeat protein